MISFFLNKEKLLIKQNFEVEANKFISEAENFMIYRIINMKS